MSANRHASTTLGGFVHVMAEHFHSVMHVAPDLADAINVTAAASGWTFGAAVDVINGTSATAVTNDFDVHYILVNGASANTEYQIDIFDDGTEVSSVVFEKTATVDPEFSLPVTMPIAKGGSVITAKLATKAGGSETVRIKLKYHEY